MLRVTAGLENHRRDELSREACCVILQPSPWYMSRMHCLPQAPFAPLQRRSRMFQHVLAHTSNVPHVVETMLAAASQKCARILPKAWDISG